MYRLKKRAMSVFLMILLAGLSGCAGMNEKAGDVNFNRLGGFSDSKGQARILLISYTGEPEKGDIREYAVSLGCGMVFAYYYSDEVEKERIPVRQLESACNFGDAQDLLFKGEGAARWQFASQCLGMIPTLTDCRKSSISTNCR